MKLTLYPERVEEIIRAIGGLDYQPSALQLLKEDLERKLSGITA